MSTLYAIIVYTNFILGLYSMLIIGLYNRLMSETDIRKKKNLTSSKFAIL